MKRTTRRNPSLGGPGRLALGLIVVALALPLVNVLSESAAAAATPTLVQSAGGQGANATTGSTVAITATLGSTCTAGDTLIAMVTVAQDAPGVGLVSTTPSGWQRLYEHTPTTLGADRSPYQGWFALSNCSGVQSATFSVTSQGNPLGTSGSVVLSEFSGLPNPIALDFGTNGGSGTASTSSSLNGQTPAASGELTLTALSFYGSSPSSATPSGWNFAGNETSNADSSPVPAFTYWKVGTTATPSATFSWGPSSTFEFTMIALKAGPAAGAPNVVQETQGAFSGQSSWQLNFATGVGAGHALVAMIGTSASGSTGNGSEATTVSGGGVSWQRVNGFVQSGNGTGEVWVGFGSTGTSGSTPVTATLAGSTSGTMVISEVAGISSVDTSSANAGTSTTPTPTSITPTAGDFVVGLLTTNPSSVSLHPSPTWSTFSVPASSYAAEWKSNVPGTASAPQWSTTPSGEWITVQAAFGTAPASTLSAVGGGFSSGHGTGINTLAVSPTHVGDVLVLSVRASSTSITASSVSGGGASTWTKLTQRVDTTDGVDEELWMGPVTTTGSATVTVTFSASVSSTLVELVAQEFSSAFGSATTWAKDTTGGQTNTSSSTVAFPSLTPTASNELYVGYGYVANAGSAGSTPGVTYDVLPSTSNLYLYDTNVSSALAPSAPQSPAGTSSSVGALLSASGTATPTPAVTQVNPNTGPAAGGTTVVITGTNLSGATSVKFGATAATGLTSNTATSITVTSPTGTGTVDVTVTTPGGTSPTGTADHFAYTASTLPTVTSLSPTSGPTAGGTTVVITGTNLSGATSVKFGATAATGLTSNTATSITVTSPAGTGTVDVTVTTPNGTSATNAGDRYTYGTTAPATITPVGGITSVDSVGATTLAVSPTHVGDVLVLGVRIFSTSISVSSVTGGGASAWTRLSQHFDATDVADEELWMGPVTTTGSATIAVTFSAAVTGSTTELVSQEFSSGLTTTTWAAGTSGGQTNATSTAVAFPSLTPTASGALYVGFAFVAQIGAAGSTPGVTYDILPTTADVFLYDTSVSSALAPSATQSPAGTSSDVGALLSATGTATPTPAVTGVSPGSGPAAGGTSVLITGTNLSGATSVKFGATAATGLTSNTATSITVTAPAGTGTVDVTVTTPGGTSPTGTPDLYAYTASTLPTVTSLSPTTGPTAGGTTVVITGTNLSGATAVNFGSNAATGLTSNTATSITVTSPTGTGTVDVTIATPNGTSATNVGDRYTYAAAPTVTGISPNSGTTAGGTSVMITGTNFTGATSVEFGTVAAISVTVNSSTSITATTRAESPGMVDTTVLGPGGTSATSTADQYTFVTPPTPAVTGVSPGSGSTGGGTTVVITGTNLSGASSVKFGSTAATGLTSNTATSITVTAPAGTGTVDVTVTTPGGTSATVTADHYAYTTSAGISAVGNFTSARNTGGTTLAVAPAHVGDVLVLSVRASSTSITASSVGGGGASTWTKLTQRVDTTDGVDEELWMGPVTTTGSATVTVTFSASVSSTLVELVAQEFSSAFGSATTWAKDTTGGQTNTSSSTVAFPSLTPTASNELYVGYGYVANAGSAGSTPGVTYDVLPTTSNLYLYDTNVSSALAPSAPQSPAGTSSSVGALLSASATGGGTPAPTVTGVSPNTGSTAGGTSVLIAGANFTGATSVMFGTTAATGVVVNSSTSITATSPAEPGWKADVTVTTPGGTSATGAVDTFTFQAAAPVASSTPHVMVLMEENESYGDLIGNPGAPNFSKLAQDYGSATQSYAIGHPSLPNYIELISGSNYGVVDDGTPQSENISSGATTIANQLQSAGISWRSYFESMPSAGYTGGDTGGTDPYGGTYYIQHHNPFIYFPAVTGLSGFSSNEVPLSTNFTTDLNAANPPAFVWVTPNAVDDMHDGPELADGDTVPTVGDAWLGNFIGGVQASSWYAGGGQIVIEFDEGLDSDTSSVGSAGEGGGGHIPTIVISAALAATPQQDATPVNTAGLLRSIETLYGVPTLQDAANSANGNIDSLLTATPSTTPTVTSVSPTAGPAGGGTSVVITGTNLSGATAVNFGSNAATGLTSNTATSITVTAPAGTGTVDVTVTTPNGTSPTVTGDHYAYAATPAVTGVSPGSGPTGGGTTVVITGTNLSGATSVKFGSTAATGLTSNTATSITVTAPAGTGTVDVTVTTPGGTSATVTADHYAYTTSAGISAVGNFTSARNTGGTTLAVAPAHVGDVLVLSVRASSTSITASSVSGGGASTWTKLTQRVDTTDGVDEELWMGPVTTTGSATVTVTFSASVSSTLVELVAQEFSSAFGSATTWAKDTTGGQTNTSSSTVAFPSLTPTASNELYVGYGYVANAGSAGSTPGVTYDVLPSTSNLYLYDTNVSSALAPSAPQSPAGTSSSVGALLKAT